MKENTRVIVVAAVVAVAALAGIASLAFLMWPYQNEKSEDVTVQDAKPVSVTTLPLTSSNAWARLPGPNGAIYLNIVNNTDTDESLAKASVDGDIANSVELHESVAMPESTMAQTNMSTTSGATSPMMTMRHVDSIAIPANKTTELKQGGYHIMLMNLRQPAPQAGEKITVHLEFASGKKATTQAEVR